MVDEFLVNDGGTESLVQLQVIFSCLKKLTIIKVEKPKIKAK